MVGRNHQVESHENQDRCRKAAERGGQVCQPCGAAVTPAGGRSDGSIAPDRGRKASRGDFPLSGQPVKQV
ncbi:hypothetical protein PLESHI_14768 [Plesiomonas shigelloides 302-73]|uniref:Uncharacterized protein n=1 Tax=Plesiomonas shigelloides 302-73 TaxID=1315976 RepID=R8AMH7_PLESH|nr:hypothetical protein PLESHI_14768 [Plesiomonas shigelloides 302-73]